MQYTGVVRKVDSFGRVTLPKELRDTFGINENGAVEFFTEGDAIILRKSDIADVFTQEIDDDMIEYKDKKVTRKTVKELIKLAGYTI